MNLRTILLALATTVLVACLPSPSLAQSDFPTRPLKILVPFPPGQISDTVARAIGAGLSEAFGQPVIVENKPGQAGSIGVAQFSKAAPDGYTLHMGGQPLSANVTLAPVPNLDPIRDLDPIFFLGYAQDVMMVGKDSPYSSPLDIVAEGKAKPGELNYASLGLGTSGHLATVLLMDATGLRARHVPYTNVGQMQTDVAANRIHFWISTIGGQLGYIKGGSLKALAVSGEKRASELPDTPTFKELGIPLVDPSTWFGLFAPRGTPREVITRVNADLNAIINAPEMRTKLEALGFSLAGGSPERLSQLMATDIVKWRNVSKSPAYSAQ